MSLTLDHVLFIILYEQTIFCISQKALGLQWSLLRTQVVEIVLDQARGPGSSPESWETPSGQMSLPWSLWSVSYSERWRRWSDPAWNVFRENFQKWTLWLSSMASYSQKWTLQPPIFLNEAPVWEFISNIYSAHTSGYPFQWLIYVWLVDPWSIPNIRCLTDVFCCPERHKTRGQLFEDPVHVTVCVGGKLCSGIINTATGVVCFKSLRFSKDFRRQALTRIGQLKWILIDKRESKNS